MKIIIRTLPRSPTALGGEDQIGFMLQEGFEKLGHSCSVCFDRVRAEADLVISMGIGEPAPHERSMLWCFNESFPIEDAGRLGYGVVVTNSVDPAKFGMPYYQRLPLAGHYSMLPNPDSVLNEDYIRSIGYIGNWSRYKETAIERYLVPIARRAGSRLMIFGGEGWKNHPALSENYAGMLHPQSWPYLRQIAKTWVAFRSERQAQLGMMPDRVYNLVAAGVHSVITDGPVEGELASMVTVENDSHAWCDAALTTDETGCSVRGPELVRTSANYDDRAKRIMDICAGMLS